MILVDNVHLYIRMFNIKLHALRCSFYEFMIQILKSDPICPIFPLAIVVQPGQQRICVPILIEISKKRRDKFVLKYEHG